MLDGRELLALRRTLTAARLVVAELRRVAADAPHVAPLEVPLPDKPLERRLEQALDDDGALLDAASPALAAARSDIRTARERLVQKLEAMLRGRRRGRRGHAAGGALRHPGAARPPHPARRHHPRRVGQRRHAVPRARRGHRRWATPSARPRRRATREELKVLRDLTELLRPARPELRALHQMCVAVDDLVARARWAVAVDGSRARR